MTAEHAALLIGAAIVLSTGHLCAGIAIGWYAGRRNAVVIQPVNMEPIVTSVEQIRGEMGQLAKLSRSVPSPGQEFTSLISRLTLSLDELHQSLSSRVRVKPESTQDSTCEPVPKQEDRSHRMGTHAIGNGRILEWFARPIGQIIPGENHRYPFAVQQPMAVRKGEDFPDAGDFAAIQCHDLCPSEIRYIVDHRPKVDEVVIGLGLPRPIKFLLARVEDYRSVYMYGRVGYLVTARFEATVDHYLTDEFDAKPATASTS
jgi:hypothetical protein